MNYWLTYENIGNGHIRYVEEFFEEDEVDLANARFDELKATPNLQNVTLYETKRYCSITN